MPLRRLLGAGLLPVLACVGCAYHATGTGYVEHRTSPLMLWSQPSARPVEAAPDRPISEQNCTAPIAQPTANLKCR